MTVCGKTAGRLESLDALRGFDMLFISGLDTLLIAACALAGLPDCWLARQMEHATWAGLNHHDTIFPLFLFLSGATVPFSLSAQRARGRSEAAIVLKTLRRAALLSLFAAVLGGLCSFDWPNIRYLDVLTTIGCGGGASALIYQFVPDWRRRIAICASILVGYWLLLRLVPAPDVASLPVPTVPEWQGTGPFSLLGNLCGYVDRRLLPGHFYTFSDAAGRGIFEEDGILHNVAAVATAMLGVFAGEIVRMPPERASGRRKVLLLLGSALACLALTVAWLPHCPVVMKIWSPTFVLANGVWSFALLAVFYWIIDVRGWRRWSLVLRMIGMNSIAIYLVNRSGLMQPVAKYFFGGTASLCDSPGYPSFVLSAGVLSLNILLMYWLYRRKVFFKV